MDYQPITAVWEITFACNMRCKHCGSSCDTFAPDELTEDEALNLCDQIGELGLKYVTLSGGEPFLRKDWDKIAKRLYDNKVIPNIITNGWFINEEILDKAIKAGVSNIGISIDGFEETHDFIRRKGSYERIKYALELMKKMGMASSVITTIHKKSLPELNKIKEFLISKDVYNWQLQIAMPMGNFSAYPELVIEPEEVEKVIDFAYETMKEGKIVIDLSDCIGYYTEKEVEVRKASSRREGASGIWLGCPAGKLAFGIRCNGDITGCNSIRDTEDKYYLEGNIRNLSLKEIWTREGAFAWNRGLSKEKLTGFCKICAYGNYCLGGCTSMKNTLGTKITENIYCLYQVKVSKERERISNISDLFILIKNGKEAIERAEYQLADLYLSKALEIAPKNSEILDLLGYVNFELENYNICYEMNKKSLEINPLNAYAHKGMGISLAKLGKIEEGIAYLKKAIELAKDDFTDPYYDLAVILYENKKFDEAIKILDKGREKSQKFIKQTKEFYDTLQLAIKETAVNRIAINQ